MLPQIANPPSKTGIKYLIKKSFIFAPYRFVRRRRDLSAEALAKTDSSQKGKTESQ